MTGYRVTPESVISGNWMDLVLIYALSFSSAHRLNLSMGFHPLPSLTHFSPMATTGMPLSSGKKRIEEEINKREKKKTSDS